MKITDFHVESFGHDERSTQFSVDGHCDTLTSSDYKQPIIVAYAIDAMSSNSMKSGNPFSGFHETETAKCLDTRCLEPSCNQGGMILCYAIENHPNDSRVTMRDDGIVQSLTSRMGTGGGNVPLILMSEQANVSCYGVYSHPMASIMKIEGNIAPTLTAKVAKGSADGPLALIELPCEDEKNETIIPNDYGGIVCEQPSGKLHRTGCVQQYVPCHKGG